MERLKQPKPTQREQRICEHDGWTILRFWNDDILRDIDNVCQHIVDRGRAGRRASAAAKRSRRNRGGTSMIDHLGITVSDFDASKAFYDKAMAPLGASLLMMVPTEYTGGVKVGGYGRERPTFWLQRGQASQGPPARRLHGAQPRRGRRLPRGGDRRRRQGQWRAGPAAALPPELLRRLRLRSRRQQCRSRLPRSGIAKRARDEPRQQAASIRAAASAARCASASRARSATPRSAIAACARRRAAISTCRWSRCAAPS